MYTEHSVTYGDPSGQHDVVTREVFTASAGRILGTEKVVRHWFEGEMRGWTWKHMSTVTKAFGHISEAQAWMDEMFREHEIATVKANGGTKLVILT